MVQREVGERLAAAPGTSAYGAPSVLAQVACDVKVVRAISRTVFRPVPRVDSVLVRLRRRDRAAGPPLRKLINDSFAHRRKTLPGSLALAPRGGRTTSASAPLKHSRRSACRRTHARSGWGRATSTG